MFILEDMAIRVYLIATISLEMEKAQLSNGNKQSTANAVPHVPEVVKRYTSNIRLLNTSWSRRQR